MIKMYKEVEPLYMQLHAYVRRKLYQKYGEVYYAIKYELNISKHITFVNTLLILIENDNFRK